MCFMTAKSWEEIYIYIYITQGLSKQLSIILPLGMIIQANIDIMDIEQFCNKGEKKAL